MTTERELAVECDRLMGEWIKAKDEANTLRSENARLREIAECARIYVTTGIGYDELQKLLGEDAIRQCKAK